MEWHEPKAVTHEKCDRMLSSFFLRKAQAEIVDSEGLERFREPVMQGLHVHVEPERDAIWQGASHRCPRDRQRLEGSWEAVKRMKNTTEFGMLVLLFIMYVFLLGVPVIGICV